MRINFGSIEDFRNECVDRDIHEVRRDYLVETKPAGNERIGVIGITRFKLILTASDGKVVLRLEHSFYACLSDFVNEEQTKKEVQQRTEKIEELVNADFLEEAHMKDEGIENYQFTLKKGVIEEI